MRFLRFPFGKLLLALAVTSTIPASKEAYAASLSLSWSDVSTNESGFKIERMAGANQYSQIATVQANVKSYADTAVTPGTTYCYRVKAFNSAGDSGYSNAGCATAVGTSPTPTGSSPTPGSSGPTPTSPPASSSGTITRLSSKWNDYRLNVKIRSGDNDGIGVMFRYQDSDNYYRFLWYPQDKSRRLEKRIGGGFKTLAQDAVAYESGRTYALQIVAQGSALAVRIDGKTIFSVTDSSLSEGTIALYSFYNAWTVFDDVLVEEIPSGKVLLSDNFNSRDHVGWTIVDEGEDKGPSVWSAASGSLVQSGNLGSREAGDLGTYALFTKGSWTDYRVSLKIRSADNDPIGVLFRFQDNDNYYRFSWDRESPGRRLIKQEKGIFKVIAQDAVSYISGKSYTVEVIAQGSSLKINVDGKPVFSVTDPTFKSGSVALYSSHNAGSIFDDILVEEIPTKAVLLWDNFNDGNFKGWLVFDESTKWGASAWSVVNGELIQRSNTGTGNLGTFVLY